MPTDEIKPEPLDHAEYTTAVSRVLATGVAALLASCSPEPSVPIKDPLPARELFDEVAAELQVQFVHRTGSAENLSMPGIMGGGGALFDYDGDGLLDLYLVQSGEVLPPIPSSERSPNQLFRQQGAGTFLDVTELSGTGDRGYGMGAAVGDIDNDGDLDLFVSNYGPDVLLRNEGDGTFTDVSKAAGVADEEWSMSAAFLDADRDGWLDLYVTRYVRFRPETECALENGRPEYCGPTAFSGEHDLFYRNRGDGTFEDRSVVAGLQSVRDAGLGVVAADFDGNGWVDLFVANDADPNNLWINQKDGRFVDRAVVMGVAYNRHGAAEAGMGVALGDVDRDGHSDLFVTHLIEESNTLYRSLDARGFEDSTAAAGLDLSSFELTGFGTAFFDFDNNGALDLAVVNGAVKRRADVLASTGSFWDPYAEPNLLLAGDGHGGFARVGAACGTFCREVGVSRSLLPGDLDGDGGVDLVVTNLEGTIQVYRNVAERGEWLAVDLFLPQHRREALGATLAAWTESGCHLHTVGTSGGYLSSSPARVHLGLGNETEVTRFEVRWPSGEREIFPGALVGKLVVLSRGEGEPGGRDSWTQPCVG